MSNPHEYLARLLAALTTAREKWRQDDDPDTVLVELFDETDRIAADRAREAVAESFAGLDAAKAEATARRARILNTERGTT